MYTIYKFTCKYFDPESNEELLMHGIIYASSFVEAIQYISNYFGDDYIEDIHIHCTADEHIYVFEDSDEHMFTVEVKDEK